VSSKQSPEEPTLFLDRNLGRHVIGDRLRSEGIKIELHDDHLLPDSPDEDWIKLVGQKNWVAITKDKNIRYRFAELASIQEYSARIIVVRMKNATGPDIADSLLARRQRIANFVVRTPAPFVAGIYRGGAITLYQSFSSEK